MLDVSCSEWLEEQPLESSDLTCLRLQFLGKKGNCKHNSKIQEARQRHTPYRLHLPAKTVIKPVNLKSTRDVKVMSVYLVTPELPYHGRGCRLYVPSVPSTSYTGCRPQIMRLRLAQSTETRREPGLSTSVANEGGEYFQNPIGM